MLRGFLSPVVVQGTHALARPASPAMTIWANISVLWCFGVAVYACAVAIGNRSWRSATQNVLSACYRLQVIREDAVSCAAQMIKRESSRDRADAEFIGPTVSGQSALPIPKLSIAVLLNPGFTRRPQPARVSELYLCPETMGGSVLLGILSGHRSTTSCVSGLPSSAVGRLYFSTNRVVGHA